MDQVCQLMPGIESSTDMYYSGNDQDYRCVGHLRGDFGQSGEECWTSFWQHDGAVFAGEDYRDVLAKLVRALRKNLFRSRKAMREYIRQYSLLILEAGEIMSYQYI